MSVLSHLVNSDPIDWYDPTVAMDKVHRSQALRRFVRKPNQVSGSYSMAAEIWWAALGTHPHRPPIQDGDIGVMLSNLDGEYVNFCKTLWLVGARSRLHPKCKYIEGKGFYYRGSKKLVLDNGRIIEFRSGTQDVTALEGLSLVAGYINEPPRPGHWSAFMARCSKNMAPLLMNFTPVGRPLPWLRKIIEGDPETGTKPLVAWDQHIPELTVAACTTVGGRIIRTQASIDQQIKDARTDGTERQRVFAAWEGETVDRRFRAFSDAAIISEFPDLDFHVRLGLDHGEGVGKQVAICVGYDVPTRTYYVLGETVSKPNSGPRAVGQDIKDMLDGLGWSPWDVSKAFGDINSAGFLGGGHKINKYIERGLADVYELAEVPIGIDTPSKKGGSVAAGEIALNHALGEDRFWIHDSCPKVIEAMKHYQGPSDPVYKDIVDALRYSIADLLIKDRMKGPARLMLQ